MESEAKLTTSVMVDHKIRLNAEFTLCCSNTIVIAIC